jgi:hypothetical protein
VPLAKALSKTFLLRLKKKEEEEEEGFTAVVKA